MPERIKSSISSVKLPGQSLRHSPKRFVVATYEVKTDNLTKAATAIARGQSIGNPTISALGESQELVDTYCAKIRYLAEDRIEIYYPKTNFGREGINYLMSVLMGGQCDIDLIRSCKLVNADFTALSKRLHGPQFGIDGIRNITEAYNRPLIGAIIKPKIGIPPQKVADIAKQMADGGADFIKEDEILADQRWCLMKRRIPLIAKALQGYKTIYAACITGDGNEPVRKAKLAKNLGAGAVHLNIWASLGAYREVRERVHLPLFFQKSGDKVWTTGPYSIDFKVICKLVNMIGCDFAHVGMYGGYMAEPLEELRQRMKALGNTVPSFSCGVKPEHVPKLRELFGNDIMITSGGYVCGHPKGITQAVKEFRNQL